MSWLQRRMMANVGGGSGDLLPEGYTRVHALTTRSKSYSRAWIDTGYLPNSSTSIITAFGYPYNGGSYAFGSTDSTSSYSVMREYGTGKYIFRYGTQEYSLVGNGYLVAQVAIIDRVCYVDGQAVHTFDSENFTAELSLYLGGLHEDSNYYQDTIVYDTVIREGNTTIADYVCCLNPSGVAGVFDLVSQQFLGSANAQEFGYIPIYTETLPSDCTALEYVSISGIAYFLMDFGVLHNGDHMREWFYLPSSSTGTPFGADDTVTSGNGFLSINTNNTYYKYFKTGSVSSINIGYVNNGIIQIDASRTVVTNGVTYNPTSNVGDIATVTGQMGVGWRSNGTNPPSTRSAQHIFLVEYCDASLNVIARAVPCIKNGVAGMYDVIGQTFYASHTSKAADAGYPYIESSH